jgi:predicted nucleotidyltransferase
MAVQQIVVILLHERQAIHIWSHQKLVKAIDPNATVILYVSYARGDYREDSDIDMLILLDIDKEKLSHPDKFKITSKTGWAHHRVTPYYENVNKEGIILWAIKKIQWSRIIWQLQNNYRV